MKLVSLLTMLLVSATVLAQPGDNTKLKPFIDKFNQYMDEIKKVEAGGAKSPSGTANKNMEVKSEVPVGADDVTVKLKTMADNAKKQIEHIKRRDPNYDVSKMEALLQPYFAAQAASVNTHNARIDASIWHDSDEGCYGLFKANTTTEFRTSGGDIAEDIKKHSALLEAYNNRLDNILKNHMTGVQACETKVLSAAEGARNGIAKQKKDAETRDGNDVIIAYRELLGYAAYWNAAHKLYPAMKEAADVHQLALEALVALGSMDNVLAKAKARKLERLKNTFMPKAVVVNAALEAEFKEAFLNEGWDETIIKINITSREWSIIRQAVSGAIICRTQSAAIVAKQKNGNCILYDFTIKQQYTGSGYSSISSRYTHGVYETEFYCENAK